jgi:hypothetical protein
LVKIELDMQLHPIEGLVSSPLYVSMTPCDHVKLSGVGNLDYGKYESPKKEHQNHALH